MYAMPECDGVIRRANVSKSSTPPHRGSPMVLRSRFLRRAKQPISAPEQIRGRRVSFKGFLISTGKLVGARVLRTVAKESVGIVVCLDHVPVEHPAPTLAEVLIAASTAVWASLWGATACVIAVDASAAMIPAYRISTPIDLPVANRCYTAPVVRRHGPRCQLRTGRAFWHPPPVVEPPSVRTIYRQMYKS